MASVGNFFMGDSKTRGTQGLVPFWTGYGKNNSWVAPRVYNPPTGYGPGSQPQFGSNPAYAPQQPAPQQPSMVAPPPAPAAPQPDLSAVAAAAQDPAVAQYFAQLNAQKALQGNVNAASGGMLSAPPPGGSVGSVLSAMQNMPQTYDVAAFQAKEAARQAALTPEQRAEEIRRAYTDDFGSRGGMQGNPMPLPPAGGTYEQQLKQAQMGDTFLAQGGGSYVMDDFGAGGGYDPNSGGSGQNRTAPGGGTSLGQYEYDYTKNNTIPTKVTNGSDIPGIASSAAANYLEGPAQYFPGDTVAPYSDMQHEANYALRQGLVDPNNWTNTTGNVARNLAVGSGNQQANNFTGQLINRANEVYNKFTQNQPTIGTPSGNVSVGNHGLNDFLGPYGQNPYMEQVIGGLNSDAQRYLNETLLPQDRGAATAAGQYGGSRSGIAEGLTRTRVGEELLQKTGDLRYGDYNNYLKNKLEAGGTLVQGDIGAANAASQRYAAEAQYALGQQQVQQQALRDILDFNARIGGVANTGSANNIQAANVSGNLLLDAGDQALKGNTLLAAAGAARQEQDQKRIDADKERWDFGQNAPTESLKTYAGILGNSPESVAAPGTPVTTQGAGFFDYVKAAEEMFPGIGKGIAGLFV